MIETPDLPSNTLEKGQPERARKKRAEGGIIDWKPEKSRWGSERRTELWLKGPGQRLKVRAQMRGEVVPLQKAMVCSKTGAQYFLLPAVIYWRLPPSPQS